MGKYTKRCSICKLHQFYSEFPLKKDNTRDPFCLGCKKTYQERQKRQAASQKESSRKYIRTIKATTPCADCGRKYHYCVMDFDHRDGETKLFNLSSAWSRRGQDKIEEEIAKCDVVCANCHRIRTHRRAGHSNVPNLIDLKRGKKLTPEQVDQIFRIYATGQYTQKQIAAWYGVHRSAITHLLAGRSHKKVPHKRGNSRENRNLDSASEDQSPLAKTEPTSYEQ